MAVTIHVNGKSNSLAHKGSMGIAKSTLPDVCKTPTPGGPVPIPYPVIVSMSSDLKKGTKKVKVDGGKSAAIKGSEFSRCTGDEPGTIGGIKSSTNMKEATWILYSFDVKLEGKNACWLSDKMLMNHANTACLGGVIQQAIGLSDAEFKQLCKDCQQEADDSIAWADFMQKEYKKALATTLKNKPVGATGKDIEDALAKSLNSGGVKTQTAGTTDAQGNITINPVQGPCAKLEEHSTKVHEEVHQAHVFDLQKKHGKNSPAFTKAFNDAADWANDEVNAYGAEKKMHKEFKKECSGK